MSAPAPASPGAPGRHTGKLGQLLDKGPLPHLVRRDGVIALQGDAADQVHGIVSGHVRCYASDEDGQRRILRFAGPGDVLGLSAVQTWPLSKEAVGDVILRTIPRDLFEDAFDRDCGLRREVRMRLLAELTERDHLVAELAHHHATDRLLNFLTDFARNHGTAGRWTFLPMTRSDIADHLGLSIETVSRGFTALRDRGDIRMEGSARYRLAETVAGKVPQAAA